MAIYAVDKDGNRIKVAGAGTPGNTGVSMDQVNTAIEAAIQSAILDSWEALY